MDGVTTVEDALQERYIPPGMHGRSTDDACTFPTLTRNQGMLRINFNPDPYTRSM